jgi:hypothetical protein
MDGRIVRFLVHSDPPHGKPSAPPFPVEAGPEGILNARLDVGKVVLGLVAVQPDLDLDAGRAGFVDQAGG